MMPKSLLHQTLAKLFAETERSFLFFHQLNKIYYIQTSKLCQLLFCCCFYTTLLF
jgi:hypothetical protein